MVPYVSIENVSPIEEFMDVYPNRGVSRELGNQGSNTLPQGDAEREERTEECHR